MSYWKTVATSTAACCLVLIVRPIVSAALQIYKGKASGIGLGRDGLMEACDRVNRSGLARWNRVVFHPQIVNISQLAFREDVIPTRAQLLKEPYEANQSSLSPKNPP